MKLIKSLTITGNPMGLVREHVWLDMSTPGRADFTVRSSEPLTGIVQMAMGDAS